MQNVIECLGIAKETGHDAIARAAQREIDELTARIAELEAALSNARIAMTFYREWMLAQDENSCTRYPFGIDAENNARAILRGE